MVHSKRKTGKSECDQEEIKIIWNKFRSEIREIDSLKIEWLSNTKIDRKIDGYIDN